MSESTTSGIHLSFDNVWKLVATIVIPVLTILWSGSVFWGKFSERFDNLDKKVDTQGADIRTLKGRVDTLQYRQLQYHYEYKIDQARKEGQKK